MTDLEIIAEAMRAEAKASRNSCGSTEYLIAATLEDLAVRIERLVEDRLTEARSA